FAVVFRELQRVGKHERVGARRRARRLVAGIDRREADLLVAQRELPEQIGSLAREAGDLLAEPPQRLGRSADAILVGGVEEEWTKKRTERASAEVEPPPAHAVGERCA